MGSRCVTRASSSWRCSTKSARAFGRYSLQSGVTAARRWAFFRKKVENSIR